MARVAWPRPDLLVVRGHMAVLTGRPDIIAVKGDAVLIADCKRGAEHVAHRMQVLMYMLMLPTARRTLAAGKRSCGNWWRAGVWRRRSPQQASSQVHPWAR
jgi:PD-(D/E)XK nuclease superfamily protein